jgi:hypothetical protein
VPKDLLSEEVLESRWEAPPAVSLVIAMQIVVAMISHANDWKLAGLGWWVWLIPIPSEVLLIAVLVWSRRHRRLEQRGYRRDVLIALLGFVSVANAFLLVALVTSLVRTETKSGGQLLLGAMTVWATNSVAFGLWFWAFDRGGPVRRFLRDPPRPDFQFPQLENPQLAEPDWRPHLVDYIYVSFTNSIAFSPTDAMPLSRWAKLLMLSESAVSAVTVLLVAARAVNIFG